jgi:hypothetical protein
MLELTIVDMMFYCCSLFDVLVQINDNAMISLLWVCGKIFESKHPKKLSETKRNPEEDWEGNPNQPPPGGGKKDLFVCLFVPYFPVFAQFYCVSG